MKYLSIALIILLVSCYGKTPEKTGMEGKIVPSFNLLLADSTTFFDTKNIPIGQASVLFLFGPHCPYSKAEMEDVVNDMQQLKDIHFYVFTPYPFKQMKEFYNKYQLNNYSNITVGVDTADFFSNYIGARGVPFIAIYNKEKRLNKAFAGITDTKLIKAISAD